MDNCEYMTKFINGMKAYFDIEYNKKFLGEKFDVVATFNQRSAKFMLTKEAEIYAFQNNEYVFYKKIDKSLDSEYITELKKKVDKGIKDLVDINNEEHMSSIITFVFSCEDDIDKETIKVFEKFKYYKSFKFGLKGWVNVKMIYVNPKTKEIYANKYGRRNKTKFLFENK